MAWHLRILGSIPHVIDNVRENTSEIIHCMKVWQIENGATRGPHHFPRPLPFSAKIECWRPVPRVLVQSDVNSWWVCHYVDSTWVIVNTGSVGEEKRKQDILFSRHLSPIPCNTLVSHFMVFEGFEKLKTFSNIHEHVMEHLCFTLMFFLCHFISC